MAFKFVKTVYQWKQLGVLNGMVILLALSVNYQELKAQTGVGTLPSGLATEKVDGPVSTIMPQQTALNASPDNAGKYILKRYEIRQMPASYRYSSIPATYIKDASWGFFYNQESLRDKPLWDSAGRYQNAAGWSSEILSGNKFHTKTMENTLGALYVGAGMGMGFYGSGDRSNVSLNTTRDDSGYTKLRSTSLSFYGKAQWEKAVGPFYPFLTVAVGPRMFYTNQVVRTYATTTDYESSTAHTSQFSASMAYELAAGVKWRIGNHVYLYGSVSEWGGSKVKLQDIDQSHFNGLDFGTKVVHQVQPVQWMWKVGIVFDLSEDRTERILVREAYYDTSEVLDMYVVDNPNNSASLNGDTSKMRNANGIEIHYLPCPCCETKRNNSQYKSVPNESSGNQTGGVIEGFESGNSGSSWDPTPSRSSGSSGPSGTVIRSSGSGGRSALPGISAPVSRPSIKSR